MKRYISLILMMVLSVGVLSCTKTKTDSAYETVPPGPVSNIEYEPDFGGGILSYTIPSDPDFLYVRAEYMIDNGVTISRTSSRFNNSLELTGMGLGPYKVSLYAVDVNGNESEPVEYTVQPKGATVDPISETIKLVPGFGLFYIMVENKFNTVVDIKLDLWVNNEKVKDPPTFTTSASEDRVEVKGLERDVEYTIDVKVVDNRYGYESEIITYSNMTILYDDTLNMKPLKIIDDPRLYGNQWDSSLDYPDNQNMNNYSGAPKTVLWQDGAPVARNKLYKFSEFRNARVRHNEASIYLFWDGRPDTHFETGEPCAFGRMAGGLRSFEMWGSNDPTPEDGLLDDWTLIGKYTIKVPADEIDKQIEIEEGTEFQIDPDNPQFSRTFRYWRFRGLSDWPVTTNPGDRYWASGRLSDILILGKEMEANAADNQ